GHTGAPKDVVAGKAIQVGVAVRDEDLLPNQTVTLLAISLHTRGAVPHCRRVFADKEAVGLGAAMCLSLMRTHGKPIVLAHALPLSFRANNGRAQSVFTSRICS